MTSFRFEHVKIDVYLNLFTYLYRLFFVQALQDNREVSVAEDWIFDKLQAELINENTADQLTYLIAKIKYLTLLAAASSTSSSNVCMYYCSISEDVIVRP